MRSIKSIVISWTLWGISYYLYSPYLTVFLKSIVKEDLVGFLYVMSSITGLIYALIPLYTKKIKEVTIISLILSGIGLILLSFSYNATISILSIILFSMYWTSIPIFYMSMRDNVAKIWAISMIPALVIPFISEIIVTTIGVRYIFTISGVMMALTALPIINIDITSRGGDQTSHKFNLSPIIFTIIPLSISLPYLYVNMPLNLVPIAYAIGELIGIFMALFLSKLEKGLPLALLGFSLIFTNSIFPFGAIFFGISEALTALGIDNIEINNFKDAVKVTLVEILMWLTGYSVASLLFIISPILPTIYASIISVLFAIISLLTIPLISKISLKLRNLEKRCTQKNRDIEGIFPYFKFA